jgi:hypothetical protein
LEFFRKFKPRTVVALGGIPFRTLTGISGEKRTISHMRGYVFRALPEFCEAAGCELLVVPTYHPSFLRRGAIHLTGVLARDIQRAVNVRYGKDKSFILDMLQDNDAEAVAAWLQQNHLNYTLHPTLIQLDDFCRDVKARSDAWLASIPGTAEHVLTALAHDIETFESASLDEDATDGFTDTQIRLSQFSVAPGQAIAMPWKQPFIQATRWLLKLPLPKLGHNYNLFDLKVLRAVGQRDFGNATYLELAGPVHDTLQQFHFMQPDLPAHLQFAASYAQFPFPWKHLNGTNLEFYGCVDVDATQRIHSVSYRTMVDRGIWYDPQPARAAVGYENQVEAVRPILAKMEQRGLPINNERRLALGAQFDATRAELLLELDARFPADARKITPKDGYAGVPPRVKELLEEITPTRIPVVEGKQTKKALTESAKNAYLNRYSNVTADEIAVIRARMFEDPPTTDEDGVEEPGERFYFDVRQFGQQVFDEQLGTQTAGVARWCRVYEFSPNSSPQLMNYMRVRGHKIPKDRKKGSDTTNKKELERLAVRHKDDFYTKVIECREMGKMSSTYVDGFKPHADGRVHTTFTFAPATGQLSARNPSTQTYPAHGKLGKAIKSMIEAPAGYELANWDLKSYHVLITGFLAEDESYCVAPDTRILTADLQWRRAIDLREGEVLWGFDEFPIEGKRKLRKSVIESVDYIERPCVRITTDQGVVTCSIEHTWLAKFDTKQRVSWRRADELATGMYLSTFTPPWKSADLWDQGYIAGILDGEGSLSNGCQLSFAQRPGIIADSVASMLAKYGYSLGDSANNPQRDCRTFRFVGQPFAGIRALGQFRPKRLLPKCLSRLEGMNVFGKLAHDAKILKIESIGNHPVVALGTSTKTFIAEGFLSHNCRMARLDMHSFVAWNFLRLPDADKLFALPDDELMDRFRWFRSNERYKAVRDRQAKPSILGIALGLMPPHLYEMNREHFASLKQAREFRTVIERLFPKVFVWQRNVCEEAHRQGMLKNRYGMLRWFYEVYVPDGKGSWKPGEQFNAAMAFRVQSEAHGDLRERLKALDREGLAERYGLCNTIHDSILLCYPVGLRAQMLHDISDVFGRPSNVLVHPQLAPEGLVVGIECACGPNMAELQEVKF